jgi:lipopolysaccharide/colanic/teichoic acid biosynthesis glycosyltransferase
MGDGAGKTLGHCSTGVAEQAIDVSSIFQRTGLPDLSKVLRPPRRRRSIISTGYKVENAALYRAWNVALASLLLIIFAMPLAVIALALWATQGRPIFYRGARLGKDQKPFHIYKFRTLRETAAILTSNQVLPARSGMETPLGGILRECRVDEIPQLLNVLRGEMNIFGPRPVRPELANQIMNAIPDYAGRFTVKPGIVGHVQALMTHRTPKRVRSLYNGYLVRQHACIWKEFIILCLIGWGVVRSMAKMSAAHVQAVNERKFGRERRKARRVKPQQTIVSAIGHDNTVRKATLIDINDEAFAIGTDQPVVGGQYSFALTRALRPGRIKIARCKGVIRPIPAGPASSLGGMQHRYLVNITQVSQLNDYLIDRYFRGNSFLN